MNFQLNKAIAGTEDTLERKPMQNLRSSFLTIKIHLGLQVAGGCMAAVTWDQSKRGTRTRPTSAFYTFFYKVGSTHMSAFFHQHLSCTERCMPPVSKGDDKQQPFTLTFTPADNSVHFMLRLWTGGGSRCRDRENTQTAHRKGLASKPLTF